MDRVLLGKITAAVGIKGEVRVFSYIEDKTRFSAIKNVLVGTKPYTIEYSRVQKGMVVVKFSEISDRNSSELLKNLEISCNKEDFGKLPEDMYFTDELIGLKVQDDKGTLVGVLSDITNNPAHDIYEITLDGSGKKFLLPAVKEFVLNVDFDKGVIVVHLIDGILDL